MKPSKGRASYGRIEARSFVIAIIRLLEEEYKIIGSRKVIELIADDIDQVHRKYYPEDYERDPGEILWRTTSIEQEITREKKAVSEHKTVTVKLPYITREDIKLKAEGVSSKEHDKIRIKRIVVAAYEQGGMLSQREVAAIVNRSRGTILTRVKEIQEEQNIILPFRGYILDQGGGTSHKGIIIELYEQNLAPPDIARKTYHKLSSVDRYIKDYEKIRLLVEKGLNENEIKQSTQKSRSLIREYMCILKKYHPDIVGEERKIKESESGKRAEKINKKERTIKREN